MRTNGMIHHGHPQVAVGPNGEPTLAGFGSGFRHLRANLEHCIACWNAIEAIGGDPATVGKMVEVLQVVSEAVAESEWFDNFECDHGSSLNQCLSHNPRCTQSRLYAAYIVARTILSQIGAKK